ncbi:MAG: glycoside hydrolase family 5 protein [Oscillospiraceae bacterium]
MNLNKLMAIISACILNFTGLCGCSADTGNTVTATETSAEEVQEEVQIDKGTMNGYTAEELISQMKTGWNLGNSLESLGGGETAWGNPETTQQMIDMIHDGGFDIIRIPVTWGHHMSGAPDYTVDADFMDRVNEVVDYAVADGMYVILEIHHEPDSWLIPDSEHMAEVEPQFTALWQQISERFKDYGDKLVFESMNEPRVKGKPHEWSGGNEDERNCVNRLNKIFVDTVRASGGNNSERVLLIATHAQAVTEPALKGLELIDDKYVGVALHAYIPYSFCYHSGESYETFEWDGKENGTVDYVFDLIDKYITSKGVPVMITECGAEFKLVDGKYNTGEVAKWATYFYGKAKEQNIPCVIWDNNERTSTLIPFGLYNRDEYKWHAEDILEAIMKVYEEE